MVIGHLNHIPRNGVGNTQSARTWHGQLLVFKIGSDGSFQGVVRCAGQHQNMLNGTVGIGLPSKSGVGAAHISQ